MTALQSSPQPNQPSREQEPFQSLLERVQHAYDRDIGRLDDDLARRNQIIESQNQRIVNLESEVAKLNKVLTEFEEKLSVEDAEKRAMLANKNALTEKYNNLRKGAAALENFRKTIVNMVQVGSAPPIIQADLEASFAMDATDPSERNELIRDVPFPKRLKQPTGPTNLRKTETALEESRERPHERDPMWSNDEDGTRGRTRSRGDEGRTAQPNGPTNLRKTDTALDETIERPHDRDSLWSNDEDGLRGRTRSRGDEGRKHGGLEEFLRPSGDSREQMSETQQSLSMMTVLSDERDRGNNERSRMGTTGHESTLDYTTLALSNADRTDFLDVINSTRSLEFPVPPLETSVRLQHSHPNDHLRVSSNHRNISARSSPSLSFTGRNTSPSKHAPRNDSSEERISGKPHSRVLADVSKRPPSRASTDAGNGGKPRTSRESAFSTRLLRDFKGDSNYSLSELPIDSWTMGLKESRFDADPAATDDWAKDLTFAAARISLHPDETDMPHISKLPQPAPQRSRHQRTHSGASNISAISVSSNAVDAPSLYRRIREELTTDQFAEFAKAIAAFNAATKTADETVKEVERLVNDRTLFMQMKTLIYRALSDSATSAET